MTGGERRSQSEVGNGDATTYGTVFRMKGNLNFTDMRPAMDEFCAPTVSITRLSRA